MHDHRFQIDLRGIIDLLANHLYSSPDIVVRELLQNAVDAITARRRLEPEHPGRVRLELTTGGAGTATLLVEDDGIGLTLDEVHEFLSTIGKSSKSEDVEAINSGEGFLSRFGIGLLSCFMLSDEITVITRSAKSPDAVAVQWQGRADGHYSVKELPDSRVEPGTRVFLRCKQYMEEYFEAERLTTLARQYAEMLPFDIALECDGTTQVVNAHFVPWKAQADVSDDLALNDYCQSVLGFKPLDTIPIKSEVGGIEGYAFITSGTTGPRESGGHRIYLRGMFVDSWGRGLVPDWAFFARYVLNCTALRPVASREGLYRDETLVRAGEELGRQVRDHIMRMARTDPGRFEALLSVHGIAIRALAREDDEFFSLIIDLLTFETNMGEVRFGPFRAENNSILVARTAEQFRRVAHIAAPLGIRVFNGCYTHHEELLVRAASRFDGLDISAFDSSDLINRLPASSVSADRTERFLALADDALALHSCTAVLRDFEPSSIPSVYGLGLDGEFHRQIARSKAMASGHWGEVIDALKPNNDEAPPTRLAINGLNPLVRDVLACTDDTLTKQAVELLYVQSLMNGMHPLSDSEMNLLNTRLLSLLTRAIGGVPTP